MKDAIFSFFFTAPKNQITIPRIAAREPLTKARGANSLGGLLVSSGALKFGGAANRLLP